MLADSNEAIPIRRFTKAGLDLVDALAEGACLGNWRIIRTIGGAVLERNDVADRLSQKCQVRWLQVQEQLQAACPSRSA